MPVIDYIDPTTSPRRIYLAAGVRSYHPVEDIYKEVRALRRNDETLRGYDNFVEAGGNVKKLADGSRRTPRYAIFVNTVIIPEDTSHDLQVTGEQLFSPGQGQEPAGVGASCIDTSTLSAGTSVIVDYSPAEAEVIIISGQGGSFTEDDRTKVTETWQRLQLDPNNPVVATPQGVTFANISIDFSGDGETSSTATRQP